MAMSGSGPLAEGSRKRSGGTRDGSARVATRRQDSKRRRRARRPHRALAWVLAIATIALCLAAGPRIRARSIRRASEAAAGLFKREAEEGGGEDHGVGSLLRIPYDKWLDACPPGLKPLFVAFLVIVITFLFCTISITASDFFCPNLATVAAYMGLSETTAGVTLLAFGNGSPDVFSTFVAVKQDTFGLAIGELIGAASFITSIVVGSIAMVRPFHVPKVAFLRDVTFFTAAVMLLMLVLRDGKLTIRESGYMVALYALYVAAVVSGSWWSARKRRKEAFKDLGWKAHNDEAASPGSVELELPGPSESLTLTPTPHSVPRSQPRTRRGSVENEEDVADRQRATWSLLGAVEFRDAINALKREGVTPGSSRGGSHPASPIADHDGDYFGARPHHHRRGSSHGQLGRDGSLRRAGRSRSSSLVASWLRSRQSSGDHQNSHEAALASLAAPLEPVPASPVSAPTPNLPSLGQSLEGSPSSSHPAMDGDSHPLASNDDSHPLAEFKFPNRRKDLHVHIAAEDEPLSSSPTSAVDVPAIAVYDPHGSSTPLPLMRSNTQASVVDRVNHTLHRALHTLFPSLQGFWNKSFVGMVLAILSTPALLVLTVTLPVVDDGRGDEGGIALPGAEDEILDADNVQEEDTLPPSPISPRISRTPHMPHTPRHTIGAEVNEELHYLLESSLSVHPRHMPDSSAIVRSGADCGSDAGDEEECVLDFSPRLAAMQCIFGPVVCTWLLFQDEKYVHWVLLGATILGSAAAALVYRLADDGMTQPWRLVRCCAGFVCSMVWIATIADEVVAVLQTFGELFGLSDAIIGLTIFAVGNSLADLVANVTIAQFSPNMAYAACFGGPMLNLLLGVGGSGTYSILMSPTHKPVLIDFSPTLWVSGTGLLLILAGTAIIVPINSFLIDRRWAMCLLVGYAAIMTANVIVEIRSEGRS